MPTISLCIKSLLDRKTTAFLTVFSIAISVMLLLGVERIKNKTKTSFSSTISSTDLIVGARSGAIQLLLYSIFRIGNATNNVTWKSYIKIVYRDILNLTMIMVRKTTRTRFTLHKLCLKENDTVGV